MHTRTSTKVTLGRNDSWTLSKTLWASVLKHPPVIADWQGNQSSLNMTKITFRGKREFDVASTRFICAGKIYKPIQISYLPADSTNDTTIVYCSEITKLEG